MKLRDALKETRVKVVTDALAQTNHDPRQAAKLIGVNRTSFYRMMQDLGIRKTTEAST